MNPADFEAIQKLKAEWDSLQPLSKENEDRLWRKLRLEWDYHSNHIEGNTLTYGETELLIIFGETRGSHTLREYEEMKAHDVAIQHVRYLANEARALSEADIRGLNQRLLKEPFWKSAVTTDGSRTQKQIIPGQYKVQPNNVRTGTGEIFNFVDPLDVPKRMQEYLRILNGESPSGTDFLLHLAHIHHEFLLIHPFDDGNGRVARLLLNYVLLKNSYPPIVIRTEQKASYLAALHRADTSERDYSELATYLGKALGVALELSVKAAKGESIEELTDIEKEISLYVAEVAEPAPIVASSAIVADIWKKSLGPLFKKIDEKIVLFRKLFSEVHWQGGDPTKNTPIYTHAARHHFTLYFEHYNAKGCQPFNQTHDLSVAFSKYDYEINLGSIPGKTLSYSQLLAPSEMDELVSALLKAILASIKQQAKAHSPKHAR